MLAKDFANGEPICVILGDNIFDMSLDSAKNFRDGAMVFLKKVPDPQRYGVAEFTTKASMPAHQVQIVSIEEKPKTPKSDYAVTGIYCYDSRVFDIIAGIKPSARGEYEITDVNNAYVAMNEMTAYLMDDTEFWSDAGTFESYAYVNEYMNKKRK